MARSDKTLEDILDVIFYDKPATQDEIAEKLEISRRYVTQLLKPLIEENIVKRAYVIDLNKYDEIYGSSNPIFNIKQHSAFFLIENMLSSMSEHVKEQVQMSFDAILNNDKKLAEQALKLDFTTNNMYEKVRSSVETIIDVDPHSKLSKILLFSEAAYNYERIGDYSGHIAKFVINEKSPVDDELLGILKKMHKYAQKSISYATDAFINGNIESRGNLKDTEEKIHETQQKAMNLIANQMVETSFEDIEMSNYYIYISRVVKSFERMGDISVEIMDLAAEFHKDIPRPTTPRSFREKI
ncbi:PhoU family transcriptional regulator [Methanobrevibacter sp. YE315]|uniref:phosphate signaling complex PhoU family protein n=1 Tax=Methanobrevibacter sp. YE315 TaxID=1609968 RepID=UPI000764CFC6|nr:phosphate uptake regulator PhoU [Methanobrevibacter sp. YE315]AMD17742.1 PhoU family transcriptional regulator [Methanobrevibacter sp. YE315]